MPPKIQCHNCGQMFWPSRSIQHLVSGRWLCSLCLLKSVANAPQQSALLIKCKDCGQLFLPNQLFNGICPPCEIIQVRTFVQRQTASHWTDWGNQLKDLEFVHCQGCGDLMGTHGGLHKCLIATTPLLSFVKFTPKEQQAMTAQNVKIYWDTSVQAYRLVSPYNKELIDVIKGFPVSDRSFDPNTKTWSFTERLLAPILQLFSTLKISPTVITKQMAEQASQQRPASQVPTSSARKPLADVALAFVSVIPYDAARRAFLLASKTLHPDAGGDSAKFATMSEAWQRLEKELYNQ